MSGFRAIFGFILVAFALPIGLLGFAALVVSFRPHTPTAPCKNRLTVEVTLYEGSYFDLKFPWAKYCKERYTD